MLKKIGSILKYSFSEVLQIQDFSHQASQIIYSREKMQGTI